LDYSKENNETVASGVEFVYDKHIFPDYPTTTQKIKARKMVVIASGAMGTPLILERSGIGRKDILNSTNVTQIVDLPGVGATYHGIAGPSS